MASKIINMKPSEFFKKYAADAVMIASDTNIFPSVMLAQAALESGWGESGLTKKGNALFGIKAFNQKSPYWGGAKYNAKTNEYVNGSMTSIAQSFRAYSSVTNSMRDYIHFLQNNKRYEENGVFSATTPEEQANAIKAAGYATAPNYAGTITAIIKSYNLTQYDQKKN